VQPLAIVEDFDELEHLRLGVLARAVVTVMYQVVLQCTEETLHHRVVGAMALAAHAGHEPSLLEQPAVRQARVLRPLVRVMDEPRPRPATPQGHGECSHREVPIGLGTHGPADDPPRIQVEDHRQVEPARARSNGRQIPGPDPVPGRDRAGGRQAVGRRRR